jgi:hypothetical protein
MSTVNYHWLDNSIVVNTGGKTTVLAKGDVRYQDVVKCIRENRLSDIPEILNTEAAFAKRGMTLKDGLLYMDGEALPQSLSDRVLRLVEENLPIDIMVNFWQNLKKNPSYNARKMLYKFLEHNGHPLTQDGCFIAYRGVRDDFKDCHTGTFDNRVGQICEMPREGVDDNPNNTCSTGLHVACFDYAKGFGPQLVEVKVNPADVVAVPTDYNGTKMRVCKFEVVAVGSKPREEAVWTEDQVDQFESEMDDDGSFEDDDQDFDDNDDEGYF